MCSPVARWRRRERGPVKAWITPTRARNGAPTDQRGMGRHRRRPSQVTPTSSHKPLAQLPRAPLTAERRAGATAAAGADHDRTIARTDAGPATGCAAQCALVSNSIWHTAFSGQRVVAQGSATQVPLAATQSLPREPCVLAQRSGTHCPPAGPQSLPCLHSVAAQRLGRQVPCTHSSAAPHCRGFRQAGKALGCRSGITISRPPQNAPRTRDVRKAGCFHSLVHVGLRARACGSRCRCRARAPARRRPRSASGSP